MSYPNHRLLKPCPAWRTQISLILVIVLSKSTSDDFLSLVICPLSSLPLPSCCVPTHATAQMRTLCLSLFAPHKELVWTGTRHRKLYSYNGCYKRLRKATRVKQRFFPSCLLTSALPPKAFDVSSTDWGKDQYSPLSSEDIERAQFGTALLDRYAVLPFNNPCHRFTC